MSSREGTGEHYLTAVMFTGWLLLPLNHVSTISTSTTCSVLSAHPQVQIGAPRSSHIVAGAQKCTFAKESLGSRQLSQWETGAGVTKEIHP